MAYARFFIRKGGLTLYKKRTGKILIVGVLDVIGSTNIGLANGFRSLGYDVHDYNYRTKERELGTEGMWTDLVNSSKGREYDLIVFCKADSIDPYFLHDMKQFGPTWYWFMDNFAACRQFNAASYAAAATYASATASDVAERFSMVNNNAYHIFEGFDPDVYYYEDLKKIHDVVFIGNATVPRIQQINKLRSEGMKITIFGYGWPVDMREFPPVFGEDERTEINSSKVVLNLCHDDVIFSDRVTKALACGANVISQNCSDLGEMVKWLNNDTEKQDALVNTDKKWISIVNRWQDAVDFSEEVEVFKSQTCSHGHMKKHHTWEAVASRIIEKVVVSENTVR
jgi:hypothetical protein